MKPVRGLFSNCNLGRVVISICPRIAATDGLVGGCSGRGDGREGGGEESGEGVCEKREGKRERLTGCWVLW